MALDLLEYRVLSSIRSRTQYLKHLSILRKELFETPQTRYVFDLISNYHNEHKGDNLTIRSLKILLFSSLKPEQQSSYRGLINRLRKGIVKEPSVVESIVKRFAKRQLLKHAINGALDSLDSGEEADLERVRQRIDEAISVDTVKVDESYDYFRDPHKRIYDEVHEAKIATKIAPELDRAMGGGLAAGELGLIIAPTGVGKTLVLVNLGVGAMLQGKKVVHATLEISPRKVARRYDVRLTGASFKDLSENPEVVKRKLEKLKLIGAGLQVKDYTAQLCSTSDLRAYLERIYSQRFRFDLLIVDYADLMYSSRQFKEKRHELSSIVSGLRRLGAEFGVPVWTASQAGRKAGESGKTSLWDIAEDIGKANWADIAITISQNEIEKEEGIAWLKIAKTRMDKGNLKIRVYVDYDTMTMKGANKV
jgi:replicative DNA helicase